MLEPRTLSVAKKAVEAAVPAAISYGCGRHARHYINFAISRHASPRGGFLFCSKCKTWFGSPLFEVARLLACLVLVHPQVAAYFFSKSRRSSLREKWTYADSDAVPQLTAISPLARPPTKTGFQSWLGNKSACAQAEYSFRFQWG